MHPVVLKACGCTRSAWAMKFHQSTCIFVEAHYRAWSSRSDATAVAGYTRRRQRRRRRSRVYMRGTRARPAYRPGTSWGAYTAISKPLMESASLSSPRGWRQCSAVRTKQCGNRKGSDVRPWCRRQYASNIAKHSLYTRNLSSPSPPLDAGKHDHETFSITIDTNDTHAMCTRAPKLTASQLNLPYGTKKK